MIEVLSSVNSIDLGRRIPRQIFIDKINVFIRQETSDSLVYRNTKVVQKFDTVILSKIS